MESESWPIYIKGLCGWMEGGARIKEWQGGEVRWPPFVFLLGSAVGLC